MAKNKKARAIILASILTLALSMLPTLFGSPDLAAQGTAPDLFIYDDARATGWGDWSYNDITVDYANTNPVHTGSNSIAVTFHDSWCALMIGYNPGSLDVNAYDTLRFWIHGGTTGGQSIALVVTLDAGTIEQDITPVADTWTQVDVSLLEYASRDLVSIEWFNSTGTAETTFYVDDVALVDTGAVPPTVVPSVGPPLSVDAATNQHPISPYIYGMNHASEAVAQAVRLPVRRWGGNSTTRYNWEIDVHNTGLDWYFENIPNTPGQIDAIVQQNLRTGTESLLTMPLIGWTPKRRLEGHPYDCGFKVSLYGPQDSVDQWDTDCGNGEQGGVPITGNDPHDTSVEITTTFVSNWIDHLTAEFGMAAEGGVMFYDLDNEPMLWNSTHRDVFPDPLSYDEIRDRTYEYAAAIKAADPTAQTLGPVVWGWTAYFWSSLDWAQGGSWWNNPQDRLAHGDVPFIEWYLQQMQAYENNNGVRLLDYVDAHCYPTGGVALSPAGDAETQALRLRSTRSLWDPTYTDESWIAQPVNMIPRMHQWVADNYPGTKLAITEYNWGALDHINGALAQADILGIFGREGLDLATLWGPPDVDDPGAFAFRMYRNYDGLGAAFGDTSVQATSGDQEQLSIYAARRTSDGALTLMMVNKAGHPLTSTVSLVNYQPGVAAQVYRYSPANLSEIVQEADQTVTAGEFTSVFPADSITLVVLVPGGGPVEGVSIDGPETGMVDTDLAFTAVVSPSDASTPITYTWAPEPAMGQGGSAATYRWDTAGSKTITVTAENSGGRVSDTHAISIATAPFVPITSVSIIGPGTCVLSSTYVFAAAVSPPSASLPITYTWLPEPDDGQGTSVSRYTWRAAGTYMITVAVRNTGEVFTDVHTIDARYVAWAPVYLPLILRH